MDWAEWEGVASAHLEAANIATPVDPWLVAYSKELEVRFGPRGAGPCLDREKGIIFIDPADRPVRQGFHVCHETSHVLLEEAGLPDTEQACDAVASCLLLPRRDFLRDRRRTGGCLRELAKLHPSASYEVIARRMLATEPGVAWVWDVEGPRRRRYPIVTPGIRWRRREPTRVEWDALRGALESREPYEAVGGVKAWPVIEPGFVRIVSVAHLDVLEAHF